VKGLWESQNLGVESQEHQCLFHDGQTSTGRANLKTKMITEKLIRYLGICMIVAGCSTVTYSGPRRPSEQVATISTYNTKVVEIDGKRRWTTTGDLELLSGPHSLLVQLNSTVSAGPYTTRHIYSKYPQRVCFSAKPGHSYLLSPNDYGNGQWAPQVLLQPKLTSDDVAFDRKELG
jgi:hypothetical protein